MYDKDTVELALLGLSEGMGVAAVARDLGIAGSTVRDWAAGRLPHSATGKPVESSRRATTGGALINAHLQEMGAAFVFDVGAAVDFAAGNVERAPKWMQDHSLEWLYRFAKEPKRLFRRYFIDSWYFLSICAREGSKR